MLFAAANSKQMWIENADGSSNPPEPADLPALATKLLAAASAAGQVCEPHNWKRQETPAFCHSLAGVPQPRGCIGPGDCRRDGVGGHRGDVYRLA